MKRINKEFGDVEFASDDHKAFAEEMDKRIKEKDPEAWERAQTWWREESEKIQKGLKGFYKALGLDPSLPLADQIDMEKLGDKGFDEITPADIERARIKKRRKKRAAVTVDNKKYRRDFNQKEMQILRSLIGGGTEFDTNGKELEVQANVQHVTLSLFYPEAEEDKLTKKSILNKADIVMQVIQDLSATVEVLGQEAADVYRALTLHWVENRAFEGKSAGKAFITLDDIHFNYRKLAGKNGNSTITDEQIEKYVQIINALERAKVYLDITNEKGAIYDKMRLAGVAKVASRVLRTSEALTEKGRLVGFMFDFDAIGQIFSEIAIQYNKFYPMAVLEMNGRYNEPAKKIADQMVHWHRNNAKNKKSSFEVSYSLLLQIANYTFPDRNKQRAIDRFNERQLAMVEKVLKETRIIKRLEIPIITTQNIEEAKVKIVWDYSLYLESGEETDDE
jgi:hypothetical protein